MKKNLPIIIGISLPIIVVLVIFAFATLPSINLKPDYDFIFSLANHNTYDKKMNSLDLYLDNCNKFLKSGGHILFESHHPNYEKISIFEEMINLFLNKFSYIKILDNFLVNKEIMDKGRKFVLLRKP